jgi:tRNA-(ms[2]io[6]A)-hydroxylase
VKRNFLPLRYHTPDRWAEGPLSDLPALLSDHAYLERKAASNALELLNRWPEPNHPPEWTPIISGIARDEAAHLQAVINLIMKKKWRLERLHRSSYAGDLRKLVRMGRGPEEIADRLLVSALIEGRSCERFEILSRECEETDIAKFYRGLCASELGHYKVFLKLANEVLPKKLVAARWDQMLDAEARIIQDQPAGPGLHSGLIL